MLLMYTKEGGMLFSSNLKEGMFSPFKFVIVSFL